ncbi:MAG TPA: XrtA system polysaccharide deacetylase [Silvibacterium sp.]|nr:XrtA system polysaccharide deacetylase [Silvibacterium sp.]
MRIRRAHAGAVLAAAGALNFWLLKSGTPGSIAAGVSLAVICLSMSWLLASGRQKESRPSYAALKPSLVDAVPADKPLKMAQSQLVNAFTVDLEDYFQTEVASRAVKYEDWEKMPSRVESSVHRLLDLMDETNTRSTFFVLGWSARKYPGLIREVARRGHEIGCHSFRHLMVNRLTPDVFLEDTRIAKEIIEDTTGAVVEGYRAPSFSITPGTEWAFKILEQLGFSYDSSVHPVWHAAYGNAKAPRFPYYLEGTSILEIPIATWRLGGLNLPVGGGAYMRLLPYRYIRCGLSSVNKREWQPVTLYVHPWEIDYLQPAIHSGWASHARQIWGTRTMEPKLRMLLSSMRFAPIRKAYAQSLSANPPVFTRSGHPTPSFAHVS